MSEAVRLHPGWQLPPCLQHSSNLQDAFRREFFRDSDAKQLIALNLMVRELHAPAEVEAVRKPFGDSRVAIRAAGDAWWNLAEKSSGTEQLTLRMRAADWSFEGMDGLPAIDRDRLVERIQPFRLSPDMSGVPPLHDRDLRDPARAPVNQAKGGPRNGLTAVAELKLHEAGKHLFDWVVSTASPPWPN